MTAPPTAGALPALTEAVNAMLDEAADAAEARVRREITRALVEHGRMVRAQAVRLARLGRGGVADRLRAIARAYLHAARIARGKR